MTRISVTKSGTPNRTAFAKAVREVSYYKGQVEEESEEAGRLRPGDVIFAVLEDHEIRTLNGKRLPVTLFTIGPDVTFYWLPRRQFAACMEKFDVKTQTNRPFEQ